MSLINSQEKQPALLDQVHDPHIAMEPGLGGQEKTPEGEWVADLPIGVAMEPGLGGQEKNPEGGEANAHYAESQWSLALAARKSIVAELSARQSVWSQWSLALAARKRYHRP